MKKSLKINCNINELNHFAKKFAKIIYPNDIILLQGELGSGKTTFARLFIFSLYFIRKISPPLSIKSPTFPMLLSYDLKNYEVHHYDLYRLKNVKELEELAIFDNFQNNISIIEWPEMLLKKINKKNYYLIKFSIIDDKIRQLEIINLTKKMKI